MDSRVEQNCSSAGPYKLGSLRYLSFSLEKTEVNFCEEFLGCAPHSLHLMFHLTGSVLAWTVELMDLLSPPLSVGLYYLMVLLHVCKYFICMSDVLQ
jgi:hypothetical protein